MADYSLNVYENLESFDDFKEIGNDEHFVRIPPDWSVIVTAVDGVHDAIEAGRYSDVNTVGAACVTAVKTTLGTKLTSFPYVFGGTGSKMVVPPQSIDDATLALIGLRNLVGKNFDMELRFKATRVSELEAAGMYVEVARYNIYAGMCIAVFRGGGIALAEEEAFGAKNNSLEPSPLVPQLDSVPTSNKTLKDLKCRWSKMPSKNGTMMSMVVFDNPKTEGDIYYKVLSDIDAILNPGMSTYSYTSGRNTGNPTHLENLKLRSIRDVLRSERRFHSSSWNLVYIWRCIEMVLAALFFNISAVFHHVAAIQETHTEFRKFDDMLRMVIDCTTDQANAIEFCLQDKYEHGMRLFYGIHYSSHSIVTCIAENVADGTHVHLIDGDEGGYARAGDMMKAQLDNASKQDFRSSNVQHQQILTNVLEDDDDNNMDFQIEQHPHHQSFDLELPCEDFYQSTSADIPFFQEDEETGGMSSVGRDFGVQIDNFYDNSGGLPLPQEETAPPLNVVAQIEEVESLKKPKKRKSKKKKKKTSNSSSEVIHMDHGTFDLPPHQLQEVSDLDPGMNNASFMQESSGMIGESSQLMKGESSDEKPKKRKKEKSKRKKKSKSRSSTSSSSSLAMSLEKAPRHALSISTTSTTRMSGTLLDGNDSSSLG